MDTESIKKYSKEHLSDFRYAHSLMVAEEAKKLAKLYNVDAEKAYQVGLAHDIAKELSDEESRFYLEKYHLPSDYLNESYRNILHSDIGAIMAKELLSFDDAMYQAIKYHTIGNVDMNTFDKVIFIADKIGRENLDAPMKQVKELAYAGKLDQALIAYFSILEDKLTRKQSPMHPDSLELIQLLKQSNHV